MPWVVGIDEAGYGPNLGPLVQTSVAICVPENTLDLWEAIGSVVRRATPVDHRIVVDDSKAIHQGAGGFDRLRSSVLSFFPQAASLPEFLADAACATSLSDLGCEFWYAAPDQCELAAEVANAAAGVIAACKSAGIEIAAPRCVITPTARFNEVLAAHGTKAAVTGRGLIALIADAVKLHANRSLDFVIDKQGGRNYYAAMIQTALPDGWVMPQRESAMESSYRVEGLGHEIRFLFRPRAESESMPVALASMVSKYVREVLMGQFNRFWQNHLPSLRPTAGYPLDAGRFYDAILPAARKLGIGRDAIWRHK